MRISIEPDHGLIKDKEMHCRADHGSTGAALPEGSTSLVVATASLGDGDRDSLFITRATASSALSRAAETTFARRVLVRTAIDENID
jgi:hypothetical protein